MTKGQTQERHRGARVALLTLVLVSAACVEERHPVLPPYPGEQGGLSASSRVDGGGERDVLTPDDALASDPPAVADAGVLACSLLVQADCTAALGPAFGCYPSGGAGRCQLGGAIGTLGTCLVDTDCAPGLLCEVLSGQGSFGLCQPICPPSDTTSALCGAGAICRPLPGFLGTNVGRCSSS